MERISDLKFHRMRSRSPAKSRKSPAPSQAQSSYSNSSRSSSANTTHSTTTQNSLTNSLTNSPTNSHSSSKSQIARAATVSSPSLHGLYHRHRRRSSSNKNRPPTSDPSSVEADFRSFISAKQPAPPYVFRYGRRYMQHDNYFLPSDLQEMQRQTLGTMLGTTVLGHPLCSAIDPRNPPRRILEIGCGSGYWTSECYDSFKSLNLPAASFFGMDVADLNPDLKPLGIDWTFVQHDLKTPPFPFPDSMFDLIMFKDMATATTVHSWRWLQFEIMRILRPGGTLEVREMEYRFRRILPPPDLMSTSATQEDLSARRSGCYCIHPDTKFAPCENKFVKQFSSWTEEAMVSRDLTPISLFQWADMENWAGFSSWDTKRIAIPLSSFLSWEKAPGASRAKQQKQASTAEVSDEQKALRATALEVVFGRVEALEPLLREVCGKNEEEWKRWWNGMVNNLLEENGCAAGECLEVGAWWAQKQGQS